ncbi:hypothetical protein ACFPAF_18720 [Hymenobacter endophyticus]|uniref:Cardiolipin synthase N-terminal domain-containing protein n=1 Tax=Hymenobacter endophyticus TaxID=3076335 RepID=A0ABU3TM24_9BACT|nr:hypothetical protein [Hymenobacter endophyticus]MDU0372442.1 hypothetical protein [Hymenobacter endophyticus]
MLEFILLLDGADSAQAWTIFFAVLIWSPQLVWGLLVLFFLRSALKHNTGTVVVFIVYLLLVAPLAALLWYASYEADHDNSLLLNEYGSVFAPTFVFLALLPLAHFFLREHYQQEKP